MTIFLRIPTQCGDALTAQNACMQYYRYVPSIGYACGWFSHKHKQSHTSKATPDSVEENTSQMEQSQLPQTPGPL
jgi:hypothetical protein